MTHPWPTPRPPCKFSILQHLRHPLHILRPHRDPPGSHSCKLQITWIWEFWWERDIIFLNCFHFLGGFLKHFCRLFLIFTLFKFQYYSPNSPLRGVGAVTHHPLRPCVESPLPVVDIVLPGHYHHISFMYHQYIAWSCVMLSYFMCHVSSSPHLVSCFHTPRPPTLPPGHKLNKQYLLFMWFKDNPAHLY